MQEASIRLLDLRHTLPNLKALLLTLSSPTPPPNRSSPFGFTGYSRQTSAAYSIPHFSPGASASASPSSTKVGSGPGAGAGGAGSAGSGPASPLSRGVRRSRLGRTSLDPDPDPDGDEGTDTETGTETETEVDMDTASVERSSVISPY